MPRGREHSTLPHDFLFFFFNKCYLEAALKPRLPFSLFSAMKLDNVVMVSCPHMRFYSSGCYSLSPEIAWENKSMSEYHIVMTVVEIWYEDKAPCRSRITSVHLTQRFCCGNRNLTAAAVSEWLRFLAADPKDASSIPTTAAAFW